MVRRVLVAVVVLLCAGACAPGADQAGTTATPTIMTTTAPTTSTSTAPPSKALGTLALAPGPDEQDAPDAASSQRALADLQEGDCIDLDGLDRAGAVEVTHVELVDCAEPHDAEVHAIVSLDDDPTSRHPGDEHVLAAADRVCLDAFEGYVGARYVDTRLEIVHLRPTVASWARGDRRVTCAVVSAGTVPLVGSVSGAGAGAP